MGGVHSLAVSGLLAPKPANLQLHCGLRCGQHQTTQVAVDRVLLADHLPACTSRLHHLRVYQTCPYKPVCSCPLKCLCTCPQLTHTATKLPSDRCSWGWITSQDGAADPGGGVAGLAATAVQVLSAARPGQGVGDAADAASAGGRILRVTGRVFNGAHTEMPPSGPPYKTRRQTRVPPNEYIPGGCKSSLRATAGQHRMSAFRTMACISMALAAVCFFSERTMRCSHSPTPMLSSLPYRHCEMLEQGPWNCTATA